MKENKDVINIKKRRIEIKDLPKDIRISNEEMRKIHGGWWLVSVSLVWRGGW